MQFWRKAAPDTDKCSTDISVFFVEDLAENFYVNWTSSYDWYTPIPTYFGLQEGHSYKSNCFLVTNYTADASGYQYLDRMHLGMTFMGGGGLPIGIETYTASTNKYVWSAVVEFLDDKIHVDNISYTFDTVSSGIVYYSDLFTTNSGSISCFNPIQNSTIYTPYSNASNISDGFGTIRVLDYTTGECEVSKATTAANCRNTFCVVDWVGVYPDATNQHTRTNDMVSSLQKYKYYGDDYHISIPLEYGQDINKCVPFVSNSYDASVQEYCNKIVFRDYVNNGFIIRSHGDGIGTSMNDRRITCNIVEFGDTVNVYNGATFSTDTSVSVDIEAVDLERAFLHFYYYIEGATDATPDDNMVCGYFTSSSGISFIRYSNTFGTMNIVWYVVECVEEDNFWKVDHLFTNSARGGTTVSVDVDISPKISNSAFIGSYTMSYNSEFPNYIAYNLKYHDSYLSTIDFSRWSASSTDLRATNIEVIHFKDANTIYGTSVLSGATVSGNIDLDTTVDLSRSMVTPTQSIGCAKTGGNSYKDMYQNFDFLDDSTLVCTKEGGTYDSYGSYFVYQFPEYNKYYIEGYVQEIQGYEGSTTPVSREVNLYRADTQELVSTTTSVSGTGYFYLETSYSGIHFAVCLDDTSGTVYNDLIYGKMYPTIISGTFSHNMGLVTEDREVRLPIIRQ